MKISYHSERLLTLICQGYYACCGVLYYSPQHDGVSVSGLVTGFFQE
jgi:hypothetical protein